LDLDKQQHNVSSFGHIKLGLTTFTVSLCTLRKFVA